MLSVNPCGNVLQCPVGMGGVDVMTMGLVGRIPYSIWASRVHVFVYWTHTQRDETRRDETGNESRRLVSQTWMVVGRACLHLAEIASVGVE